MRGKNIKNKEKNQCGRDVNHVISRVPNTPRAVSHLSDNALTRVSIRLPMRNRNALFRARTA
jgi:hypothetical protein